MPLSKRGYKNITELVDLGLYEMEFNLQEFWILKQKERLLYEYQDEYK